MLSLLQLLLTCSWVEMSRRRVCRKRYITWSSFKKRQVYPSHSDLTVHLLTKSQQFLLVGQITWSVSVFFIRASVLALYMRIFRTKSFRITGYIVHGVNAAFLTSTVLAVCLICRPLAFSWDPSIRGGTCGDQKSLDLYIGILNLFVDITVVVLPMPVLWGLQMAVSRKLVLSGMFGLGIMYAHPHLLKLTKDHHLTHESQHLHIDPHPHQNQLR